VLLLEFGVLTRHLKWSPRDAALRLLPGALMLLAVRAALTGMAWPWVAFALAASFPVHLADLTQKRAEPA